MHHASAAVTGCRPAASDVCQRVADDFANTYGQSTVVTAALLLLAPALIGAFTGVPLLAREFETGTFRYAFTQGMGRTRWTLAKLVPLALVVTAAAAAFGTLFSWAFQPIIGHPYGESPLQPLMFAARGVAFPGWTLATFAMGALAGVLIDGALHPIDIRAVTFGQFEPGPGIEGGWLLALSVLLIVATVWLVRRRAT